MKNNVDQKVGGLKQREQMMTDFVEIDVPLRVAVKPEDGKIIDVGLSMHRVDWVDGGPSSISYCNNCGGGFILDNGVVEYCGKCHVICGKAKDRPLFFSTKPK